jgi:imidazole glycerol-phosphate synthase subunit HisH
VSAPQVCLVDYGLGNLRSVANALVAAGAEVALGARPEDLRRAERVVLPGVGAFGDGIRALRQRELDGALTAHIESGRPLLGICLGMQLLFAGSDEFGDHQGLGLFPGRVRRIDPRPPLKVPHVGWSRIHPPDGRTWADTPLAALTPGAAVYFVHSYAAVAERPGDCLAQAGYGGDPITAAVQRDRVLGCQFHPEKSGPLGLALLAAFLRW